LLTYNITGGQTYTFRLRANNKWGWGAYSSPTISILAASVPSQMDRVMTSINPADGSLKISWTAPFENGNPITAY
jgi:hypothetical protein